MQIIILIENTTIDRRLTPEFGLSLYISANGRRLLFDMGATDRFLHNARILGVDPAQADMAVISHAHHDHGGGLAGFLSVNDSAPVYLKAEATNPCYATMGTILPRPFNEVAHSLAKRSIWCSRYIGLDPAVLQSQSNRMRWLDKDVEIDEHITILTRISRKIPLAEGNKFLMQKTGEGFLQDPFDHELLLVIEEHDGLAVITGCGHSGILNMMESVARAFPDKPVKSVIGGFHLVLQPGRQAKAGTREDIVRIGNELLQSVTGKVYTGHCTGDEAFDILKEVMGDKLQRIYTGLSIAI